MIFSLCVTHFDQYSPLHHPIIFCYLPCYSSPSPATPFFSHLAHFYHFCGFIFGPMYFTRGVPRSMDEIWFSGARTPYLQVPFSVAM